MVQELVGIQVNKVSGRSSGQDGHDDHIDDTHERQSSSLPRGVMLPGGPHVNNYGGRVEGELFLSQQEAFYSFPIVKTTVAARASSIPSGGLLSLSRREDFAFDANRMFCRLLRQQSEVHCSLKSTVDKPGKKSNYINPFFSVKT